MLERQMNFSKSVTFAFS